MNTLLVVDDDEKIRGLFHYLLEGQCRVLSAANPEEAMKMFGEEKPEAVILDLDLGTPMDGGDLLVYFKLCKPSIPVFIMTANVYRRSEVLLRGADAFLNKPFDLRQIRKLLVRSGVIKVT